MKFSGVRRVGLYLAWAWPLVFGLIMLAALAIAGPGCAGSDARRGVLTPAMLAAWPGVRADAARGIEADRSAGRMPESISLRAERLELFDRGMQELER